MNFKTNRFVFGGIAFAVFCLLVFVVYGPVNKQLRKAKKQTRAIEQEVLTAREKIKVLKQSDTEQRIATQDTVSLAIEEFTKIGRLKDINYVSIVPQGVENIPDSVYKVLPVDIEMDSNYETLGTFLGLLRDLKKGLITVRSFHITPDKHNSLILRTKITLLIYLSD